MTKDNVELVINRSEGISLRKMLNFVLAELEFEYFTRTGFYENESKFLIGNIESVNASKSEIQNIVLSNQQLFNLRQNLVEVLFGIPIDDYAGLFGIRSEELSEFLMQLKNMLSNTN